MKDFWTAALPIAVMAFCMGAAVGCVWTAGLADDMAREHLSAEHGCDEFDCWE